MNQEITEFAISFIDKHWDELINTEFHIIYKRKIFLIYDIRNDYLLANHVIKEVIPIIDTEFKKVIISGLSKSEKFIIRINDHLYIYEYPIFLKYEQKRRFIKDVIQFMNTPNKIIRILEVLFVLYLVFFSILFINFQLN